MSDSKDDAGKSGKCETAAALAVGFFCLVIGIPLWWKTTTTYRASLPYSSITQLYLQQTTCSIPVTLVWCGTDKGTVPGAGLKEFEALLPRLLSGNKERSSLSIQYSIYSRACLAREKRSIDEARSLQGLDDKLHSHQQGPFGGVTIYTIPTDNHLFADSEAGIYLGGHRSIFVEDSGLLRAVETIVALIKSVIVSEAGLQNHYKTSRGIVHSVADLESMRSFRYKPGYELSFTLLVPEPHNVMARWDLDHAQKVYLDPMIKKMGDFAEFTAASQVLYYTGLSVRPKQSPGGASYHFPYTSLGHIITPVEAKLGSHVTSFPNLNFVVYIPPLEHSPLYIHTPEGEPVDTNAFLSPRWGGMLIHNAAPAGENATSRPLQMEVESEAFMPVFLMQLRLLLGIPTPHTFDNVQMQAPAESAILDWEYESLLRRHCIENLATASATLFSLSQLLEKISNIVIKDDIAKQVFAAVRSIESSHQFLREGKLKPAFHASKRAIVASEMAFFDPSLLELLYFPDDQKFAIYIPLFLPIGIPVLMSLIKAVKMMRTRKSDKKDKID